MSKPFQKGSLIAILSLSLLLCSCSLMKPFKSKPSDPVIPSSSRPAETTKADKPNFTKDTFPKIDGSTATIPLSEAIASSILSITKEDAKKYIKHNTTHEAYLNLIEGKADIIFVTEPSKEELELARKKSVDLEIIPVVKEGFVFLVNTKNPVNSLTAKQIQDIYQGKIKNWKEVGGQDSEIIPYQRDANSGSQTLMEQTVMKGLTMMESPKTILQTMGDLIESIAAYDNSERALGYSVYYYAKTMYTKDTIKLIGVNGVLPDNKNIASGKYPFTSSYFAVLRKTEAKNSSSRELLKWLLSSEGQKLAETAGYVPLEVK